MIVMKPCYDVPLDISFSYEHTQHLFLGVETTRKEVGSRHCIHPWNQARYWFICSDNGC